MGVERNVRGTLIADTSFVSVLHATTVVPAARNMLPCEMRRGIATAKLSISVVTVAELRAGHLKARWGPRRRRQAERWLCRFPHVSVDSTVADAWATLKELSRRQGRSCSENDLWIAATGYARRAPVITCDRGFIPLGAAGVEVIYVPRNPAGLALRR